MKFQPENTVCFLSFLKVSFFATIYFTEAALYMKPTKGVRSVTLSNLLPHSHEGWSVRKIKQDNRPNNSMMDLRLKYGEKLFPITHLVSTKRESNTQMIHLNTHTFCCVLLGGQGKPEKCLKN